MIWNLLIGHLYLCNVLLVPLLWFKNNLSLQSDPINSELLDLKLNKINKKWTNKLRTCIAFTIKTKSRQKL